MRVAESLPCVVHHNRRFALGSDQVESTRRIVDFDDLLDHVGVAEPECDQVVS
jgi:hypothetical protein